MLRRTSRLYAPPGDCGGSARRPAEMATADLLKDSKPPLTLRPNFKSEKGSVTAAAATYSPRRGIFDDRKMLYLRVMHCRTVQVKLELFSFFASFFFSAKKRRVAADLTPQFQE